LDADMRAAKDAVERSIDGLLEEFLKRPYLHRVEHSLHCRFFQIMSSSETGVNREIPVGNSLAITQLIHKEWPSSRGETRRGNFDFAILSSAQLTQISNLAKFREGFVPAQIAIEIGLDYGAEHLAGDLKKLSNSPHCGYIIHLLRGHKLDDQSRNLLVRAEDNPSIKCACVSIADKVKKRLGEPSFVPLPRT
jgi:hypothetical protein